MKKSRLAISVILGIAAIVFAVAANAADVKVKYSGPSGQGNIIYYGKSTGTTNLVFTANGVSNLNMASGSALGAADLTLSGTLTVNGATVTTNITLIDGSTITAVSSDGATTNVVVTSDGVVDGATIGATTLTVAQGGSGAATFTDGGVLLGSGTGAFTAMAVLTDGQMIVGDGTTDPVAESGATLRTSIGVGTGDSPQFTGVNVGHASDTTVARASAGDISVEGNIVFREGANLNVAATKDLTAVSDDSSTTNTIISNGVVDASKLSGTSAAINGAAITALDAANITAGTTASAFNGSAITNINASNLASGTVGTDVSGGDITIIATKDLVAISDDGTTTNTVISNGVVDSSTLSGTVAENISGGNVTVAAAKLLTLGGTTVNVTNAQELTVSQSAYIINGIGSANDATNTITLAAPTAAGQIVIFRGAFGTTNLVTFQDSGATRIPSSLAAGLDQDDTAGFISLDTSTWLCFSHIDNNN